MADPIQLDEESFVTAREVLIELHKNNRGSLDRILAAMDLSDEGFEELMDKMDQALGVRPEGPREWGPEPRRGWRE